jgi:DNA-binding response OmpR family regulator
VLLFSGYPREGLVESGRLAAAAFLKKPFTPGELADRVREILAEGA